MSRGGDETLGRGVQYHCRVCGAPVEWDAEAGALECQHCGATDVADVAARDVAPSEGELRAARGFEEPPEGEDVDAAIRDAFARASRGSPRPHTRHIRCNYCGATVEIERSRPASRCTFCNSATVLDLEDDGTALCPDLVLPFCVGETQARSAQSSWLRERGYVSADFLSQASAQRMEGAYVLAWVFDMDVRCSYRADRMRDAEGGPVVLGRNEVADRYTERYTDHVVYPASAIPNRLFEGIEPFDLEDAAPFEAHYLAGFSLELPATDLERIQRRCKLLLEEDERNQCARLIERRSTRSREAYFSNLRVSLSFRDVRVRLVLVPVWIMAFRHEEKLYRCLVNGRTGRVEGDRPLHSRGLMAAAARQARIEHRRQRRHKKIWAILLLLFALGPTLGVLGIYKLTRSPPKPPPADDQEPARERPPAGSGDFEDRWRSAQELPGQGNPSRPEAESWGEPHRPEASPCAPSALPLRLERGDVLPSPGGSFALAFQRGADRSWNPAHEEFRSPDSHRGDGSDVAVEWLGLHRLDEAPRPSALAVARVIGPTNRDEDGARSYVVQIERACD